MASTHDDAFREIQLSGKQLVFLFMAVIVIAVVIFLSGVQVGRGVHGRARRVARRHGSGCRDARVRSAAASRVGDVGIERLAGHGGRETELRRAAGRRGAARRHRCKRSDAPPAPAERHDAATPKPEAPPPAEPARPLRPLLRRPGQPRRPSRPAPNLPAPASRSRSPRSASVKRPTRIVKRLAGKGYPAYVLAPDKARPPIFRVRVGKFKERREADTVAARLQKEEQFKPWVVR